LGIGARPSSVVYTLSQSNNPLDDSPLSKDATKLAEDSEILSDAPITIPLRPYVKPQEDGAEQDAEDDENKKPGSKNITARHSLGIFGNNPTDTADFARAILAHFATFHSAIDTRLYVVGQPRAKESWGWAEWLPHCNVRDVGIDDSYEAPQSEQLDQLCFSNEKRDITEFWMRLKRELDQRQIRMAESSEDESKGGQSDISLPLNLVVVDLLGELPDDSPLADVASENVVAMINQEGPRLGAAIIFLANDPSKSSDMPR